MYTQYIHMEINNSTSIRVSKDTREKLRQLKNPKNPTLEAVILDMMDKITRLEQDKAQLLRLLKEM